MNTQKNWIALALVVLVAVAIGVSMSRGGGSNNSQSEQTADAKQNAKNATYEVDGSKVTLVDGVSRVQDASGSASYTTVQYVGNEVSADINENGNNDTVFLATKTNAGTGVMYYLLALLDPENSAQGAVGFYLGDRIEI